jgi:hypothetical protein
MGSSVVIQGVITGNDGRLEDYSLTATLPGFVPPVPDLAGWTIYEMDGSYAFQKPNGDWVKTDTTRSKELDDV